MADQEKITLESFFNIEILVVTLLHIVASRIILSDCIPLFYL